MNITICTAFRNAAKTVNTYINQAEGLHRLLSQRGDNLIFVWGYGDSIDKTDDILFEAATHNLGAHMIDCTHGGRRFGSVVDAERFRQLAYVANKMWSNIPADSDVAMLVDGDLIWEPSTLLALIDHTHTYDCVAPMVMHRREFRRKGKPEVWFYDTLCFVCQGVNFTNQPPYHHALNGGMVQMDSVGACVAIRGDLARAVRYPESDVVVGLCRQLYELGGSVWLDTRLTVWHP